MYSDFLAPRKCFLEPVPAIFEAAKLLDAAVDAHLAEDRSRAEQLIKRADMPAITDWQFTVMGPANQEITRFRKIEDAPSYLPQRDRIKARMPYAAERRALKQRDGWTCRFCGMPLIGKKVRDAMRHEYPEGRPLSANSGYSRAVQRGWRYVLRRYRRQLRSGRAQ